ncbi:MAG: capsular biosynthesis protein [Ignavibacteria bacterium]|nr:capsular biosynthesis protein [Ignavibacteria bacterium]
MKKICILSAVNIRHMSMISLYTEKLKRDSIDFDIIYMDKYGEEEDFPAKNKYIFKNIINPNDNKLRKACQYFKFKNFAIPILEKNKYDLIIVWNDVAIFMFANYLAHKWKGKYCLNIRDYCYQKNPLVYMRFKKVINNSLFSTISSDGYRTFLPPYKYLHVHSLNKKVLANITPRNSYQNIGEPIRITFIGSVRYFEMNKKLLDIFKNDERFKLQFCGTNAKVLEEYAIKNSINNTYFHDTFQVSKTADFIEKTDLVNNLYGSGSIGLDTALSIKLYYGIFYRTPILVLPNTYMAEIVQEYDIGYVVESISSKLPDEIFGWYRGSDFDVFNSNCEELLKKINCDNEKFELVYQKFFK